MRAWIAIVVLAACASGKEAQPSAAPEMTRPQGAAEAPKDQVALGGPAEPTPRAAGDPCEGGQIAQQGAGAPMSEDRAPGGTGGGVSGIGVGGGAGGMRARDTANAPRLALGTVKVDGALPPEVVRRIVRQHLGQLRYCYEQTLLKNPKVNGLVVVHFEVDANGAVTSAEVTKHLEDGLDACLVARVKTLEFPKPEKGTVKVQLPLNFSQAY